MGFRSRQCSRPSRPAEKPTPKLKASIRELLTDPNEQDEDATSALDAAADFLTQVLGSDVVPSKSIYAEAKEAGIAKRTLERASDKLAVKKRRRQVVLEPAQVRQLRQLRQR